jgi:hypothetical protein
LALMVGFPKLGSGAPPRRSTYERDGRSWNIPFKDRVERLPISTSVGRNVMKSIVSILAVAIAIVFTAPAFAGPGSTITNKEDCEKAGKVWDDAGKKCVEKQ